MKNDKLGIKFILTWTIISLVIVFVSCIVFAGCASVLSGNAVNKVLTTAELAGEIAEKVDDLHDAGVDRKILDEVHQALSDAHDIIDKHHKNIGK